MTTLGASVGAAPYAPVARGRRRGGGRGRIDPLRLACAFVVGAVLLLAAVMKLATTGEAIRSAHELAKVLEAGGASMPLAQWLKGYSGLIVSPVEILFAGALVLWHTRWWMWTATAVMFSGFAGYTAFELAIGAPSCGCFGAIQTPPIFTLSIDVALALVALALATWPGSRGRVALWPLVATLMAAAWATGYGATSVLKKDQAVALPDAI